jgi:hypothetical protein
MKRIIVAISVLLLAACASQPIYDVKAHPVPVAAQTLPQEKLERLIIDAGQSRGWLFERTASGKLRGTQHSKDLTAVVDVVFDQHSYSINHVSTSGMKEQGGTIHPHYNFWVRNLEHDIETWLTNGPVLAKP